ncbi:unnamed protein product [Rhizoctonia solani]|nr:unnamed protein product [Rhizoctonia solani]
MDTFAVLALATNPALPELLKHMPDRKTAPLFSVDMGKMIIGQGIYHTFIRLSFRFLSPSLVGPPVLEGVGQYVVVAVSPKSFNSRIMAPLAGDTEITPLLLKLNALAEPIAEVGSAAGLILFTALMIKIFVQLKTKSEKTANQKAMSFVQILISQLP